ncbi:YqjF family protein [Arthrobacter sp. TMN-37]
MDQSWLDAVFLHWRIPAATAARYLPAGVDVDEIDGSAWVGLIGFRMVGAGLGQDRPVPYLGTFTEINVRLYSRGPDGVRGVVFVTLDASRLAVVLAARAAGINYVWSRCRPTGGAGPPGAERFGYDVRRRRGGASSSFSVRPDRSAAVGDSVSLELTARYGLHTALGGRTLYIPNTHQPWPLFRAETAHLQDSLVAAAGFAVSGPPESVLYSPGVQTQFGRPGVPAPAAPGDPAVHAAEKTLDGGLPPD